MSSKCRICKADKIETELKIISCKHKYCWICIEKYLKENLKCKNKCPKCAYILKDSELRNILSADDIDRYEEICMKNLRNRHACLLPECGEVVMYDDVNAQYTCKVCGLYNCIQCKKAHANMLCGEQESRITGESIDVVCNTQMKAAKDKYQIKRFEWQRMAIMDTDKNTLLPNPEVFNCTLCYLDIGKGAGVMLRNCFHKICRDCLNEHVRSCNFPPVGCPFDPCTLRLDDRDCRGTLNKEQVAGYEDKSMRRATKYLLNSDNCRGPNCDFLCELKDGAHSWTCLKCNTVNCVDCNAVHVNQTCKEYSKKSLDAKTMERIRKKEMMQCPDCYTLLLKSKYSCNWIRCSHCGVELCWAMQMHRWGPKGRGDTSGGCKCSSDAPCCKECNNGCFPDDGNMPGMVRSQSYSVSSNQASLNDDGPRFLFGGQRPHGQSFIDRTRLFRVPEDDRANRRNRGL